jgi:Na+-transporting NADH:ubiquinone oxidoreductase subunit NqrC
MSETPKAKATANPNRTTAKKATAKKAVIADSTNKDKPVKKATPAKKTTAKKVADTAVKAEKAVVAEVQANPQVAEAVVDAIQPGLWDRIKAFFGVK